MNKKGFTMSEVMVVLAVIGVLAAVLTPTIVKLKPDQNKALFKKAYYITERVVNELVNDEILYTDSDSTKPNLVNESAVMVNNVSVSGLTKFCKLFAEKVNITTSTPDCSAGKSSPVASGSSNLNSGNFTTNDGITWHLPTTAAGGGATELTVFTNPAAVPTPTVGFTRNIIVDVNGTDTYNAKTSPNCTYNVTTCPKPDQFTIIVQHDGKLMVTGVKEQEYLKSTAVQ